MALGVSPERVREVRFAEQWRGYRTDEVDEFVEQVAEAFDQLEARVRECSARAAEAERRLLERGPDEDLSRTLVLAQRTADAARREGQAEADALVGAARERARAMVEEAEARRARLDQEIEARMASGLHELTQRRAGLEADVAALRAYVDQHRRRLAAELQEQLAWLEQPGRLGLPPAPATTARAAASDSPMVPVASGASAVGDFADGSGSADSSTVVAEPVVAEPVVAEPVVAEPVVAEPVVAEPVVAEPDVPEVAELSAQERRDDTALDDLAIPWRRDADDPTGTDGADASSGDRAAAPVAGGAEGTHLDGEPGAADERSDQAIAADVDPFLAELRRAVDDPEPLGPRDDVPPGEWHTESHPYEEAKSGARRRRRRQR
jgi:cell division initiation protein